MVVFGFLPKGYYTRTCTGEQSNDNNRQVLPSRLWLCLASHQNVITRARVPVGRDTGGQRERGRGGGEGREAGVIARSTFHQLIDRRLQKNIGVSRA